MATKATVVLFVAAPSAHPSAPAKGERRRTIARHGASHNCGDNNHLAGQPQSCRLSLSCGGVPRRRQQRRAELTRAYSASARDDSGDKPGAPPAEKGSRVSSTFSWAGELVSFLFRPRSDRHKAGRGHGGGSEGDSDHADAKNKNSSASARSGKTNGNVVVTQEDELADNAQSVDERPRRLRTVSGALNDLHQRAFGSLNESFVHELLVEARERRADADGGGEPVDDIATVIPYDLQKEIFRELTEADARTREELLDGGGATTPVVERAGLDELTTPAAPASTMVGQARATTDSADQNRDSTKRTAVERSSARPPAAAAVPAGGDEVPSGESVPDPAGDSVGAAAAASRAEAGRGRTWWIAPFSIFSGFRGGGSATREIEASASKEAESIVTAASLSQPMPAVTDGPTVAAATAAVASLDEDDGDNSELTAVQRAELQSAVRKGVAVTSVQGARDFIESVGVGPLVLAARVLDGPACTASLGALANLATLMPSSRLDIVLADDGSIVHTVLDMLQQPIGHRSTWSLLMKILRGRNGADTGAGGDRLRRPRSASYGVEGQINASQLIGSVTLIGGRAGASKRVMMATNPALVDALRHIAMGPSNGSPEISARRARRALAALGVNEFRPRVPSQRGLRVLSIDGGGTRALMTFEMLKHLKRITGCEVHEMFDVIGGTSTGAIIAGALGVMKKPVEEVEALYRELIMKIFTKNPVNAPKMLFTRAYYDTSVFEQILQRECGSHTLLDSAMDPDVPKVLAVSSVITPGRSVLTHVFRNYTYPVGEESRYHGSTDVPLWIAMRASSAAPTFFSEMRVNGEVHADGAIVANNPSAVTLHEANKLHPGTPLEVLVSCGNGLLTHPVVDKLSKTPKEISMGWTTLLGSIVNSATSTEQVHHALEDLLPESKYFRFNPPTDNTDIDVTRSGQLAFWVRDAQNYIEDNHERFERLAEILRPRRTSTLYRKLKAVIGTEVEYLHTGVDLTKS